MYREIFISNVLRLARERGWTKSELAERSNVSPSFLSELTSKDGNPSLVIMERLAKTLKTPLPLLLLHTDLEPAAMEELWESGLPQGYKWVFGVLPEHQAFIVRRWNDAAQQRLRENPEAQLITKAQLDTLAVHLRRFLGPMADDVAHQVLSRLMPKGMGTYEDVCRGVAQVIEDSRHRDKFLSLVGVKK